MVDTFRNPAIGNNHRTTVAMAQAKPIAVPCHKCGVYCAKPLYNQEGRPICGRCLTANK